MQTDSCGNRNSENELKREPQRLRDAKSLSAEEMEDIDRRWKIVTQEVHDKQEEVGTIFF